MRVAPCRRRSGYGRFMETTRSQSIIIDATSQELYDLVTSIERTGEYPKRSTPSILIL